MRQILFWFLLLMSFNAVATVVLIDPGHGGEEIGAVGILSKKQKIFEKDLSLRLAQKIKTHLSKST